MIKFTMPRHYYKLLFICSLFMISCSDYSEIDGVQSENVYIINNEEFGIYSDKTEAKATTIGINKAIEQAKEKGYNVVKLNKGDYLIYCVNERDWYAVNGLFVPTNMTLDLGEAKLYVEPNDEPHYSLINIDHAENAKIRGGHLIGDRATHNKNHTNGFGIQVIASRNVTIENVTIEGTAGDGIFFTNYIYMSFNGIYPTKNIKITDCDISDCAKRGIHLGHVVDVDVSNNTFHNTKDGSNQYAIDTNPNGAWKNIAENIKIHNNTFKEDGVGIRLWGGNDIDVYDNLLENNGIFGLKCERVRIYRNTLTGNGGIYITDEGIDYCITTEGKNKNTFHKITDYSTKTGNFVCQ